MNWRRIKLIWLFTLTVWAALLFAAFHDVKVDTDIQICKTRGTGTTTHGYFTISIPDAPIRYEIGGHLFMDYRGETWSHIRKGTK